MRCRLLRTLLRYLNRNSKHRIRVKNNFREINRSSSETITSRAWRIAVDLNTFQVSDFHLRVGTMVLKNG